MARPGSNPAIVAFFVRLFSLTNREVCCEIFLLEGMEGNW